MRAGLPPGQRVGGPGEGPATVGGHGGVGGRLCTSRPRTPMKGETPVNSTMSIGQARKMVEQLKIEASMCRIKVSKAAADLMTYCDAHACEDPLITPVPTSENPFREKKFFCALL
ncbi:guanine nucleotide-binding protein G(I)/G(S)/G(O) subunit gamma-3 [Alligator mississippiensis]|uniref:Guanine nucleotide-binding protein subunit gamma n=1 Tax=Alligator mississippiensis TaxID=8496 RepID=A0A151LZJ9_ALLMI|nr:guanine nucleotide-binding protein G(I)/G(S)/G(O) subunit gamma-3 [Alligator mississippiensis]